jgi:phosphatidylserine/phosphatidylglycerophosphate/cardiolipin synthase-like enzyme
MKQIAIIAALLLAGTTAAAPPVLTKPTVSRITTHFSPHGGTDKADADEIARAKKTVRVFAYSFTSAVIADALVAAKQRGIDVQMVVDPGVVLSSKAVQCIKAGIPVWVDHQHAIMHNKVLIVDGKTVATGSFNFSVAAEQSNAENSLIIDCPPLADAYLKNWEEHRAHSVRATTP